MLDELASSISNLNLERVRRFKGHLLALTQRVQKVRIIKSSHHFPTFFFLILLIFSIIS